MVMWPGFDWQSKAAVVVVMVFFPLLFNCVEGGKAADPMQRDLMQTWGQAGAVAVETEAACGDALYF